MHAPCTGAIVEGRPREEKAGVGGGGQSGGGGGAEILAIMSTLKIINRKMKNKRS